MKEIQLTKDKVTLVDDADFEWLNQHKWHAQKSKDTYYAVWSIKRLRKILMHREILGFTEGDGENVDHKNRNGLDNRRKNLRECTNAQNQCNRPKAKNNTSGYKGVYWHKRDKRWIAQIRLKGICKYLGYFNTPEQAARAYDKAARKYQGEFAKGQIGESYDRH